MDYAKWLGIVTNIGVLGGLILVAYQIQQTNDALDQQALSMQVEAYQIADEVAGDFLLFIAGEPELTSIWMRGNAGEELDDIESNRYRMLAISHFRNQQALFATWNALGEGRGGFAVSNLQEDIDRNPGMRHEYIAFRQKDDKADQRGYYKSPDSTAVKLNRNYWDLVDEVLE